MLALLLPLLNVGGSAIEWLFGSKAGRIVLLAAIIGLAVLAWTLHVKHAATAAELAKEQAATAAEHQRREQVLSWAQEWAAGAIKNVDGLNAKIAELKRKSALASAANNAFVCFDGDAAARILRVHAH